MSAYEVNDSIAAIASPSGVAVRGVIRLSGPSIDTALACCFAATGYQHSDQSPGNLLTQFRRAVVLPGRITVADPIRYVDAALYYWPDSASYTRQRSAEIHCTGSSPVLNEVMRTLAELGVRQASPGEFTMRAFLAGRIDLTAAEAVLGVIDSQSDREMDSALKQLAGGLSGPIQDMQNRLLDVLAHLEAGLDFVEEDIDFISQQAVQDAIHDSNQIVQRILNQIDQRSLQRRRPRVVLLGRPNAGKSRLQNVLAEGAKAIVSDVAGTTRDYLSSVAQVGNLEIDLIDTAGTLTNPGSDLEGSQYLATEQQSVQQQSEMQTERIAAQADLKLLCIDGSQPIDESQTAEVKAAGNDPNIIVIQTKSDLPPAQCWNSDDVVVVSSETGIGIEELKEVIAERLQFSDPQNADVGAIVGSTANRCFESLRAACDELKRAEEFCAGNHGEEIVAASLRVVLDELAVVTGKVFTDDILDRVFSRFCIGK